MADAAADDLRLWETRLRVILAEEITEQQTLAKADGRALDLMDQRQIARAALQREMDLRAREALRLGGLPLADGEREEIARRVLLQVFSPMPGLEEFIERRDATNVHVMGCREVIVELLDGSVERHPSPYNSHQQVIDAIAHIARRGGPIEREFNYSNPILHMTLADGSRLTANAWIGPEPYVTVRRHPLVDHDLADLQDLGMVDAGVRSLLGAAVRARWNLLIAGGQSIGKTTLLRAMAHEADPDERLLVLESEPELALERLPHRHSQVVAISERPGNMAGEGAITLGRLAWHAKRLSPARIIVGEVLADEVVAMLEAMTQGVDGSMATIHARSSAGVFPRLPVYARSRGQVWQSSDINAQAALALDLVIFVARDAKGRRAVTEIRHVERHEAEGDQVISDAWFLPDMVTGRAAQAGVIPVGLLEDLVSHGYDPALHTAAGPRMRTNGRGGIR